MGLKHIFLAGICSACLPLLLLSQPLSPHVDSIPMRDGKKLAADIYRPDTINKYPVILVQTPYNRLFYRYSLPLGIKTNLASSKYIFVVVDWRCFYGSSSACVASPQRGKDGYDVVQWIAAQSWSDGKVGTWGPSALGKIQYQTAKEKPAALVCSVPLVAGSQFGYEEYFPGGVYRTEYVQQLDALGYGMSAFLLSNPVYNATWQYAEGINIYPDQIEVPMLLIGGWYDHNTHVMLELFDTLRKSSPVAVKDKHRLLMGPWAHGGFGPAQVGSGQQGELFFPQAAGWSDSMAVRFFDYYLRGIGNGWNNEPVIRYFQMGDNTWQEETQWPPAGIMQVNYYLKPAGLLESSLPSSPSGNGSFVYDPRNPSPTIGGPTLRSDLKQGPWDQKDSVENRSDILVFTTSVLAQPVKVKGGSSVNLYVSTDRYDTDFTIRLTDVYPDGRSMLLSDGIRRMRFRNGFSASDTVAAVPGQVYLIKVELPATAHTFLPGHRIRVDVASSNYPRFDANLNNGGVMYSAGDTLVANNTVHFNTQYPSHIRFSVEDNGSGISGLSSRTAFRLLSNPVTDEAQILMVLEEKNDVRVNLYNSAGRLVRQKFFSNLTPGEHHLQMSTSELPEAIYFLTVDAGTDRMTAKISLVR